MAEPRFRLRSPNSKKEQPITLVLRYKDLKVTIPTGYSIHPDYWNFRDQKVRNVVEAIDKEEINSMLLSYYEAGDQTLSELKKLKSAITKQKIKFRFFEILRKN